MTNQPELSCRFDKNDSAYMKGIAMLCMLMHHMFKPEHVETDMFYPLSEGAVIGGIGSFMQICVGLFLFFSGVGMFYSKGGLRRTVSRILSLYAKMWGVMVLLCIPVMLLCGRFSFNIIEFIKNVTAFNTSYCSAWWFVLLYAEIIVAEAIFDRFLKNGTWVRHLLVLAFVAALSVGTYALNGHVGGILAFIRSQLHQFSVYAFTFLLGFYASRYNLLGRLSGRIRSGKRWLCLVLGPVVLAADVLIWYFAKDYVPFLFLDWIIVPVFVAGVLLIRKSLPETILTKGIIWIGAQSVWMWLIHDILRQYLTRAAFLPRIPILVILWMLLLLILPVLLMSFLYSLPGRWKKKKAAASVTPTEGK